MKTQAVDSTISSNVRNKEAQRLIEDYEVRPVPESERQGWLKLTMVWIAGIIALSATALGGALGSGMSLSQAIIVSLVGTFLLAILNILCGIPGNKTGLSTSMISSFAMGRYGAYLVSVVIAISLFGWFGVQLDLFGSSLLNVIQSVFGIEVNRTLLMVIGGILMTVTSMIGYKAIEKLSIVAVPLLGILLVGSTIIVLNNYSLSELNSAALAAEPITLGAGISLVIGSLAVGAIIAPDFSRYARGTKDTVISSLLGYFIGYSIVLLIAILLAKATTEVDVVAIMIGIGWGTGGMLVLILAQWTTNNTNLYSSALGFSVVFRSVPKYIITIFAGIVGTVFAITGIYTNFITFLNVLSIMIPPVGGIYAADFIMRRHAYDFAKIDLIKKVNYYSIGIWAIAIFLAFATSAPPLGFAWFTLTNAPAIDAFIVAFILQIGASKWLMDDGKEVGNEVS
ncbi:cytosine permease [Salinicoccus cyprini]|uniref:Cytosine permease n=1 Tax=Salinicoccus cyprini TaxID=2493691 RepID=A0A558AXF0_9STAP|nr:cytosine permease [Salinicoccus cyprini]TVT28928.1 cytosine permease [Salinicoccus cyprini]